MGKLVNASNRKVLICNIVTALFLNLFLEFMERKSVEEVTDFINERTFVFLYNMLILFVCLSVVFIARKKLFTWAAVTGAWLFIGLVNGYILETRKTPFTAVDIMLARSTLPVLNSYLEMWQIVGAVLLIICGVVLLVSLYIYSPVSRKSFDPRVNFVLFVFQIILLGFITYEAAGRNMLIRKFDNLIAGYKDYGVAYGFCVTALDTGIDRPIDYSGNKIAGIDRKINKQLEKKRKKDLKKGNILVRTPNIIFIQLESFFDITTVKKLSVSEDPLPNFHRLQEEYTSGYLKVPVYGAGTINTEFEVISGMNTGYFGTGEYPYRSVLHDHTCDSVAYWLKDFPYQSTVVHNNNASFYDRDHVLSNLGFDNFITIENMNIQKTNEAGWARDAVLTDEILNTLEQTEEKDMIYTISVQGHGDYPTTFQEDARIRVTEKGSKKAAADEKENSDKQSGYSEAWLNQLTYYANQTYEMDEFIGDLITRLSDYPEDVMVIAYGDHLPGMDFKDKDLSSGSKYKTPYFIWDNFGYNKKNKDKESGDLEAYQLASKVLAEINIQDGILNRFHQAMKSTENYKKNLKLLQYDLLYGADFISRLEGITREPTELNFSLRDLTVSNITRSAGGYFIFGKNFTPESRVYVGGRALKTKYYNQALLEIAARSLRDEDEIIIHQVSQTNENITLNVSKPYVWHKPGDRN